MPVKPWPTAGGPSPGSVSTPGTARGFPGRRAFAIILGKGNLMSYKYRYAAASALLHLYFACCTQSAFAQQPTPTATQQTETSSQTQAAPASLESVPVPVAGLTGCCTLVDGSPVELEIADVLNTMTLKRGDRFRIRLHAPVNAAEGTVLPAGVEGVGEVVHVEPGRASGKAAELILAARYLDYQGKHIKLRGMKLSASGSNRSGMVAGVSVAIGVFAAFIHGGNIEIPANTVVSAKIGETIQLPLISMSAPLTDNSGALQTTGMAMEKPSNSAPSPSP
jgi:hypothetical protein